ncbi:MAG: glycosyltransferase family 4 protein [Candidatus Methanoperedens sp.]|nr:glycosyltransferase family 4 protein [Candidatus Methanoperedens sp.]
MTNYDGIPDEGIKNVSYNLFREISKKHEVLHINSKSMGSVESWRKIKHFRPQIVHVFLRPTIQVLIISKLLKIYLNNPTIIISALQPPEHKFLNRVLTPLIKSNLFLTQSDKTEKMLHDLGANVQFFPNGIDIGKFDPVDDDNVKNDLRIKYGIDTKKFVLLHIGHINKGRNLSILNMIQKLENVQVIVVGSTNSFNFDSTVYNSLIENGCIVWRKYFDKLEEIYQLSDCYIFPTVNQNYCIEIPLSILEAMSCNLPVITTKFGALERIFTRGDGLFFVNSENEFQNVLYDITSNSVNIQTRNKVIKYGWSDISHFLEKIYFEQVSR